MTGLAVRYDVDDAEVQAVFGQLIAHGEDLAPAMDEIGGALAASTQLRFERGEAPGGAPWPESIRARLEGGQTLVDKGLLSASIAHVAGPDFVDIGVEGGPAAVYAAIHQFGGTIRAKNAPFLVFRVGGRFARKKQVTIPARPFLGVDDDDRTEIAEILRDHLLPGGSR